jgi:uncharacterized protein DUF3570
VAATGSTLSFGLVAVAAAAVLLVAPRNWAQNNEVNVQAHSFVDSRAVTVLSPTVELAQDFTERTSLRIKYGVDSIWAASQSCLHCHPKGADNLRQEIGLSATRKYGDAKVSVGGAFSDENFYRATTGLASISRDLAAGNATVAGGFSFSLNQPVLHPLRKNQDQYQSGGFVSVTQTVSKTTIAQAGYEIARVSGYQDSPFFRPIVDGVERSDRVPGRRTRHTLSGRLRQALPADTYLEADYRRYADDWEIASNAISVGLSHYFRPEFLLALTYRRYDQTAAFFWAPEYAGRPQYYTGNFRLEPFTSNTYTGRVVIAPKGQMWFLPEGTALTAQVERYQADNGFDATIVSTGLRVPVRVFTRPH